MTREEREAAIAYIKGYRKLDEDLHNTAPKDSISYYATDKCLKYWDMAIQALSQEPCGAISRQSVINVIENDCMRGGLGSCFASYDDAQKFRGEIEQLPSVTQKPVIDDIRIELINEAKEHMREGNYNDGVRFGLMLAEQIVLRHRGKEQKPGKWINVNDMLPREREDVLVTCFVHENWQTKIGYWNGKAWVVNAYDILFIDRLEVIAWMPLPEPYNEESEED